MLEDHLVDALVDGLGEVCGLLDPLVGVHEYLPAVVERYLLPRPDLGAASSALVRLRERENGGGLKSIVSNPSTC